MLLEWHAQTPDIFSKSHSGGSISMFSSERIRYLRWITGTLTWVKHVQLLDEERGETFHSSQIAYFLFQRDGASPHRAKVTKNCPYENGFNYVAVWRLDLKCRICHDVVFWASFRAMMCTVVMNFLSTRLMLHMSNFLLRFTKFAAVYQRIMKFWINFTRAVRHSRNNWRFMKKKNASY